jgi:NADP-dependent 3-hydroxy acid dehydrogenase YdfG
LTLQDALSGKVAWVVGGGTGIGAAIAEELGRGGATVVVSGRREAELLAVCDRLFHEGVTAAALPMNVRSDQEVAEVHDRIVKEHGHVDILIFSAGTNVTQRFWVDLTSAGFSEVVDVNLNGAARTILPVLANMRKQKDGLVVVVSSWAGWTHSPTAGAAYSASKTALSALVETINAQERLNGIRATHLCPGEVKTDILQTRPVLPTEEEQARMLLPEDLGKMVRYIAESPARICFNELVITPTTNATYAFGIESQLGT